uniref:GPN-loop GTPase n=1 Tax=Plectus sambesii TaxID=2011161 RepID=A0A914WYQ5_9BILA
MDESTAEASASVAASDSKPTCVIVLGMAGSGKTTFVQRLTAHLHAKGSPPYVINLDPAVSQVPYPANVDIRDTVKYKEVMKQYNLGPNGAIMTSLNLFATRFDQAMGLIEKRKDSCRFVILDTPGQIEVFTWSASGAIITETLASTYPTVVVYVMDCARSTNPVTFMSNMLYACSILYRTKLPFIVVLNKADIVKPTFALKWLSDFESFQEALEQQTSFMTDLTRSLSLVLDEFYGSLKCVAASAVTGEGMPEVLDAIAAGAEQYEKEYKPQYERLRHEHQSAKVAAQTSKLGEVSLKERPVGSSMQSRSEMLADERIHLGGVEAEDAEDERERVFGQAEDDEEDDTEADKASFQRFMEQMMGAKKS